MKAATADHACSMCYTHANHRGEPCLAGLDASAAQRAYEQTVCECNEHPDLLRSFSIFPSSKTEADAYIEVRFG